MATKPVERKYKVDCKDGKTDYSASVTASNASDAVRRMFPTAGAIFLKPAEHIVYIFEAEVHDESGKFKVMKGEVKLARTTKEGEKE